MLNNIQIKIDRINIVAALYSIILNDKLESYKEKD